MSHPEVQIQCPVQEEPTPDLQAFAPLLERLQSGQPITTDEIFPRGTLRADGRLDLCKQDAGVLGCQAVTEALRHSNAVQSLLLGTNGIGDAGAAHVAALVREHPLRTVYLGCNLIGAPGTEALAEAIRAQPQVKALWLKRNPIGPAGAHTLAGLLRDTATLRTLDVVHTGIGDEGARVILQALATGNTSLQYLYLSGNALTPAILPEVTAVLAQHPTLRGLYLSVNHLGDAGAFSVAQALGRNTTLDTLGMASCGIGDAGLAALLTAGAAHPRLHTLDVGDAPSARTLGASRNTAGPQSRAATLQLFAAPGALRLLQLPRMTEALQLQEQAPAHLTVRVTGSPGRGDQTPPPFNEDAADIRSVYR
ncbi:hypothetical protein GCM10008959_41420 [Deinococcus seoulensis]|uniref:Uncharacterized protein n=1 Tax=Deinococcus seoulensis TaxID=1837379 RepID=A0ABQ2RZU2_9DEIO|nr:ribonuclease inhibitor [Deinococcus seoulensis]GGR76355.1 hypothetical protein GCM10008959_41420 [Deinococcus seoulensis]